MFNSPVVGAWLGGVCQERTGPGSVWRGVCRSTAGLAGQAPHQGGHPPTELVTDNFRQIFKFSEQIIFQTILNGSTKVEQFL